MDVRIRVGAALDATAALNSARRVRQQLEAELGKPLRVGGGGRGGPAKQAADDAEKAARATQRALSQEAALLMRNLRIRKAAEAESRREAERTAAVQKKAAEDVARAQKKAADEAAAVQKKAADDAARAAERRAIREANEDRQAMRRRMAVRRVFERQQARAAEREERDELSFGRRTSYRAIHHMGGMARAGTAVARDIARGAGVKTDLGSLVGGAVELERRAVELSNQAYLPGEKGPRGVRQDPKELMKEAVEIGNFAAFDPVRVLQGLQAFTAKTGDLEAGRDVLKEMATLSRATGAEFEDMIDAAGDAAMALEGTENRGAKTAQIMKVIAGQGKLGAVEIKNLASQMAKLGSSSTAFGGDPMENLSLMGAFVQMSRAKGGSASATQAATSVASFVNTLRTPARMDAFKAATGKEMYDKKTGLYRSSEDIVLESLKATEGNPKAFKKIFMNVQGARAVEGFADTYRRAGGGDAGLAAVRAEFDKFRRIAMSQEEISESFKRSMATAEAKVQLFNNELSAVGSKIAATVLPKMEKLGPVAVDAVDALGDLAAWVAENPLEAAFTAMGVSITRAAGEAVIRAGIESAVKTGFAATGGAAGGAGGAGGPGLVLGGAGAGAAGGAQTRMQKFLGPGGAIGALGGTLAIAATAVTIGEVGWLAIKSIQNVGQEARANTEETLTKTAVTRANIVAGAGKPGGPVDVAKGVMGGVEGMAALGGADPAALKELQAQQEKLAARIEAAKDAETGIGWTNSWTEGTAWRAGSAIANYISGGAMGTSLDEQARMESDKAQLEELVAEYKRNSDVLQRYLGGTINVNVMNIAEAMRPQPTGSRVDMSGEMIAWPTP